MDQKQKTDHDTVKMVNRNSRTWGFDLLLHVMESVNSDSSLPLNANPAEEECGPEQPRTERQTNQGSAPPGLQQTIKSEGATKANPPNNAPAEEERGPRQHQTERHVHRGSAMLRPQQPGKSEVGRLATEAKTPPLLPDDATAEEERGPRPPRTESQMLQGSAPLGLKKPVNPVAGSLAAKENPSLPNNTPAEEQCGPQQPRTEMYMPLRVAPFNPQQPRQSAAVFFAAKANPPLVPAYYPPAEEARGPQQPQTESRMPQGSAALGLQQPVNSAAALLAAKNNHTLLLPNDGPAEEERGLQQPHTEGHVPQGLFRQTVLPAVSGILATKSNPSLIPNYYSHAEEKFSPQQHKNEYYRNLGSAQFSRQQQAMTAPLQVPSLYNQPTIMQPNYMYCQPGPFHQSQVNSRPVVGVPQPHGMTLVPVGIINGEIIYGNPPSSAPSVASSASVAKAPPLRRKRYKHIPNDNKPYVKKPPNAFMMYRKEQMPNVVKELQIKDCAAVNKIIGERWMSMSKEEQAKYYEQADKEKELHSQRFPDWSTGENYGKKRKRIRRRALTENSEM